MHDNLINDFNQLKQSLNTLGHFRPQPARVWITIAAIAAAFLVGAFWHDRHPFLSFVLATLGGITLVWWIHDAGHDAYFENKKLSQVLIEFFGIVFLGMPQIDYHYFIHRKHHALTNRIGGDPALETGPVRWGVSHVKESGSALPYQQWIWFFGVLPLTWPLITLTCLKLMVKTRAYLRIFLLLLRWTFVVWWLDFDFVFILGPILITGFVLGFSATLNHFHLPISKQGNGTFPASVFRSTQNISSDGWFMTWLMGGLNFHIEHHLFPRLPSYQLKRISPYVKEFASFHGLPYNHRPLNSSVTVTFATLQNAQREVFYEAQA